MQFRQVWMAENGVMAICGADSRAEMDAHVADLPLFKAGLMDVEPQEPEPFRGFSARQAPTPGNLADRDGARATDRK